MEIVNIDEADFKSAVLNSSKLVTVCFWSEWCDKCCMQGIILDEMNTSFKNEDVLLAKVKIDDNTEMIDTYEIKGLPLILFFWKGKLVEKLNNLQTKEKIVEVLNDLTKKIADGTILNSAA